VTRTLSARTDTPLATGSMRTHQDHSLQEEKEGEHSMGTGSDSDAKEDEDSDNGSDSEGDCFSTISIEDNAVNNFEWTPPENDSYTGFAGGPFGWTNNICSRHCYENIFFATLLLTFFSKIAELTHKYCYKDWVVKKTAIDSDGNPKKRPYLETVPAMTAGQPTPGRRHRTDRNRDKWRITPRFIICWLAIIIIQGAHFGSNKKKQCGKCGNVRHMVLAYPIFKILSVRCI